MEYLDIMRENVNKQQMAFKESSSGALSADDLLSMAYNLLTSTIDAIGEGVLQDPSMVTKIQHEILAVKAHDLANARRVTPNELSANLVSRYDIDGETSVAQQLDLK